MSRSLQQDLDIFNDDLRNRVTQDVVRLSSRYDLNTQNTTLLNFIGTNREAQFKEEDEYADDETEDRGYAIELQHLVSLEHLNLTFGGGRSDIDAQTRFCGGACNEPTAIEDEILFYENRDVTAWDAYIQASATLAPNLELSARLGYRGPRAGSARQTDDNSRHRGRFAPRHRRPHCGRSLREL